MFTQTLVTSEINSNFLFDINCILTFFLQIQCLGDKKKIQLLLDLTSCLDGDLTYLLKEPPAKAIVKQRKPAQGSSGHNFSSTSSPGHTGNDGKTTTSMGYFVI